MKKILFVAGAIASALFLAKAFGDRVGNGFTGGEGSRTYSKTGNDGARPQSFTGGGVHGGGFKEGGHGGGNGFVSGGGGNGFSEGGSGSHG